jgi:hypothetical protein
LQRQVSDYWPKCNKEKKFGAIISPFKEDWVNSAAWNWNEAAA